jgi:hypothetical protein
LTRKAAGRSSGKPAKKYAPPNRQERVPLKPNVSDFDSQLFAGWLYRMDRSDRIVSATMPSA